MIKPFHQLPWTTKFQLWFFTLFYHENFSLDYTVDCLVEPVFWFVDHYTKILGKFFVGSVVFLVSFVAFVAHALGLPFWWNRSPVLTLFLIVLGYWLLVNIFFNFYQAVTVSPGQPVDSKKLMNCSATICKVCISPKPARTHHCSVCKTCYLKMDHHCPWVNNCIGHFNHRYFYLTAAFIAAGCVYVMLFGVELAYRFVFLGEDILKFHPVGHGTGQLNDDIPGPINADLIRKYRTASISSSQRIFLNLLGISVRSNEFEPAMAAADLILGFQVTRYMVKGMLYVAGFLCIGASLALGGLCWWHGRLISNGETSIEYHINKSNRKKLGDRYVNLYDLGRKQNWIVFLGLDQPGRSFWRHILLPSSHPPTGDGYDWSHLYLYARKSPDLESENYKRRTS